MSVLIFANGEMSSGSWVKPYLDDAAALIAADGGARHIRTLGRMPDVVIGDMDSTTPSSLAELQASEASVHIYPEDKDATDLELALRYAAANYDDEILILGSLGGRLDQLLANVFMLADPFLHGKEVKITEEYQEAWVINESTSHIRGETGDLVSLLPLGGDVEIGSTQGLAWPLQEQLLVHGRSLGVSNVMTADTAVVDVRNGKLLCIHTAKAWRR